jgi:hypothetical protein
MEERPTGKGRGRNKTIIDGLQHKSMEKQIEDGKEKRKKGHGEIQGEEKDTEKQRPNG